MKDIFQFEAPIKESKPRGRGRTPVYPFRDLEIGQSFLTSVSLSKISAACAMHMKRNAGIKLACETQPDSRIRVTRRA